ncbi:hypothetical protein [Spiroplasma endosymbiont of Melieria omissa]|uniref:hypothetical protein n=1 Tax=Spiroplasma endosymbiont of Melieria omissa TaxID=3139324 RepID=UPI003CCA7C66
MAIKDPLMFITIEEFKNWNGFNKLEFDDTTTPDNEIWFAISVASNNIDYLSGHSISKKWPETTLTEFTDEIQTATAYYVRFLLTKDSNYIRGQSSISQGGMTYSENNPTDPYFIVPEVFNCLRKIKEYPNITGFNLDVLPKRNDFFSNFYSNCGEDSPLTRYLEWLNLKTNDPRVKIYPKYPKNIIGTEVWIDTTDIKSFDNLTTLELFNKYFSNDSLQLVDGKESQQEKVISISDEIGKLIESKQPLLTPNNAGNNITITGNGENIKISAIGGSGESLWETDPNSPTIIQPKEKRIITSNNKRIIYIADPEQPQDGVNLRTLDKKLKETESKFPIAFQINAVSQEISNLETTDKTIAGAINEINKNQPQPIPSIPQWKEVGTKVNINHIRHTFKSNTKYKIYYNFESQSSNKKFAFMSKEFLYGELNTEVQTLYWDKVNERIIISLQMQNDTIAIVSDPTRYGQLLKLEELQE